MIRTNQTIPATVAEQLLAIDVFAELLASADPAHMGKKLTEQIQEITGAKTVILVTHTIGSNLHEIIHATPERRVHLFSPKVLQANCPG